MLAHIKNNIDFTTKDILEFEDYSFSQDIEYSDKSAITVFNKPNINNDDFVFCKDGNEVVFIGICEDYSATDSSGYTINLKQKECFFDRQIFVENAALIKTTGIEDFIKNAIERNWTASGDSLMDKGYITVVCGTHTPVNASVNAENGIYNLKTFLGNAKEYYGIYTRFTFTDSTLVITIYHDTAVSLPIDVTISDVSEYTETYSVDVLAKLITKWHDTTNNTDTMLTYYLKSNRTITTNAADPDRAYGVVKSFYTEQATQAEAIQEITNQFKSNSYEHKISFKILATSKAYQLSDYYVGRKASIKTRSGIQTSLITKLTYSNNDAFVILEFGKLKITLIERLRDLGGKK